MSVFNAGTPAEMICEGSRWPLEHLTTTVAAQLVQLIGLGPLSEELTTIPQSQ